MNEAYKVLALSYLENKGEARLCTERLEHYVKYITKVSKEKEVAEENLKNILDVFEKSEVDIKEIMQELKKEVPFISEKIDRDFKE